MKKLTNLFSVNWKAIVSRIPAWIAGIVCGMFFEMGLTALCPAATLIAVNAVECVLVACLFALIVTQRSTSFYAYSRTLDVAVALVLTFFVFADYLPPPAHHPNWLIASLLAPLVVIYLIVISALLEIMLPKSNPQERID